MKLDKIRRLAAAVLKTAKSKIWLDSTAVERIGEVITKDDVRALVKDGLIKKRKSQLHSRAGARALSKKKQKGRKKGWGKRTGRKSARIGLKDKWMSNVRAQRRTLKELREKYPKEIKELRYSRLYKMIKGNYFKGKKYLEAYVKGKGELK